MVERERDAVTRISQLEIGRSIPGPRVQRNGMSHPRECIRSVEQDQQIRHIPQTVRPLVSD
jgi:hypothetical protein